MRLADGAPCAVGLASMAMLPQVALLPEAFALQEIWAPMPVRIGPVELSSALSCPSLANVRALQLTDCVGVFAGDTREQRFAYLHAMIAAGGLPCTSVAIPADVRALHGLREARETTVLLEEAFPKLSELVLHSEDLPSQGWIYKTRLGERIQRVRGVHPRDPHRALFALIARRDEVPRHIERVVLSADMGMFRGFCHALERDEQGRLSRLRSMMHGFPYLKTSDPKLEKLVDLLEALPVDALTSFQFDSYKGWAAPSVCRRIELGARRQAGLRSLRVFGADADTTFIPRDPGASSE